jgi:sugar lactone lactonase YvrE
MKTCTLRHCLLLPVAITLAAGSPAAGAAQAGTNPYRPVDWGRLPEGRQWGPTSAIHIDRDLEHVWVFDRCGSTHQHNSCLGLDDVDPILKFDPEGNLVTSFGRGYFVFPHGMTVDHEGNVWVTDAATGPMAARGALEGRGHQVFKFSAEGELLMTLGTAGEAGAGPDHFNGPNDVVVAPNGDIFVAEGHNDTGQGNDRVVKFAPDGTYLMEWGGTGTAHGQFLGPHAIAMDSQGRVFVGDRGNNRIQIFDQNGNLLQVWTQFGKPSGIFIDRNDVIYVADSESATDHRNPNPGWERGIRIGDARTGWVTAFILWEDGSEDPSRPDPGPAGSGAEGVTADIDGNLYLGIVRTPRVQKYVKIRP